MTWTNDSDRVRKVIVIPTYLETESIKNLLSQLVPRLSTDVAIVICDDSGVDLRDYYTNLASNLMRVEKKRIDVSFSDIKSGRGHAVRRGLRVGMESFPKAEYFVECDADESHAVKDILKITELKDRIDFVIGSRYLKESEIIGWPLSRRAFSRVLNILIPKLLKLNTTDATNGLRRYSRRAVERIVESNFRTSGFIVLSEIAVILKSHNILPSDLPTKFVNRQLGKSTVNVKEIIRSASGLLKLCNLQYGRK